MHGQPNHAPLDNPERILEVGCGTGAMTSYFSTTYPAARDIIGIDLSPVPPQPSSSRATFIEGDFRQLAKGGGHPQLQTGSFDYVFSRMLVYGMNDWPGYIAQARDMLNSGGWLELQDMDFHFFDENKCSISESLRWLQDQTTAWMIRGLDVRVGHKLEQYMKDAGLVDVQVREYRWVFGRWEGHPETDMIGEYSPKFLFPVNIAAYKKVLGPVKSADELFKDEAEMKETMGFSENGQHFGFFVVCGRKP